jgi:two-component system, cell cycle response regulator
LAERIRRIVESEPVRMSSAEASVTVSLGVAVSADPKHANATELLRLADEALYRAKNRGRNRSELAAPGEPRDSNPSTEPTPLTSAPR